MTYDHRIEKIYHKGQEHIWNGSQYLNDLCVKHGKQDIPEIHRYALQNIFSVIYWGELAAWKISAALALCLDDRGARMAATSQAHDEARHFYTMEDYLKWLDCPPHSIDPYSNGFLESVLHANNPAKMLLGMQLMVEPLALTLFKLVRERKVEPVLCDLLLMYERDEARHVALGTLYLPTVLNKMNMFEVADLLVWQFREYMRQFSMLEARSSDFRALGIEPRVVFEVAKEKQIKAMEILSQELGRRYPFMNTMIRVIDFRGELSFPTERSATKIQRLVNAFKKVWGRDV